MSQLTQDQIQAVVDWMNNWEQLKDTSIPIRFEEDFLSNEDMKAKHRLINLEISPNVGYPDSPLKKPPIGLKPQWIHNQARQGEIMKAIARYLEAGLSPPKEWALEFASYCELSE